MIILDWFIFKSFYTWFNQCNLDYIAMQQRKNTQFANLVAKVWQYQFKNFNYLNKWLGILKVHSFILLLDHIFVVHIWPFVCST
jgi:hypothetical protein